jgi:hypothetical protein
VDTIGVKVKPLYLVGMYVLKFQALWSLNKVKSATMASSWNHQVKVAIKETSEHAQFGSLSCSAGDMVGSRLWSAMTTTSTSMSLSTKKCIHDLASLGIMPSG